MKKERNKMSPKAFTIAGSVGCVALLVVGVLTNVITNYYKVSLNNYVDAGKQVITAASGTEDWDTAYYETKYSTIQEAREENSAVVAQEIAEEGITLLKNDGVLPLTSGDAVTPFGLRYVEPLYGGTGSGNVDTSMDYVDTAIDVITENFTVDDTVEQKLEAGTHYYLAAPTETEEAKDWSTEQPVTSSSTMFEYHTWLDEFDPDEVYDESFLTAANGTVGIVFVGRVGGESNDIYHGQYGAYADGTQHELQLSEREKETIRIAKANCESVIVVIESSNVMEIGDLAAADSDISADAILWMGGAGAKGFAGLASILTGEVNPSGHLPDTWMASIMDDPTSTNFGDFYYNNLSYGDLTQAFIEYDEGIYLGYRYYETVYDLSDTFTVNGETKAYGTLDDNGNVTSAGAVVYPFGYGLSYTTFSQEIISTEADGDDVTVTVKVTNTGSVSGKSVVQLYYNPPYTDLDVKEGIEKATANLIAYDKTKVLGAGESQTITLTFAKEDMASYGENHDNGNDTIGCYMLEAGTYELTVGKNSHEAYDTTSVEVAETIWYDGSDDDHIRQSEKDAQDTAGGSESSAAEYIAATNQFQESVDYMAAKTDTLTRASGVLTNTVEAPTEDAYTAADYMLAAVDTAEYFDPETDEEYGNVEGSKVYAEEAPTTDANNGIQLIDLRGISYDDPKWDELLDELDLSKSSDIWTALLSGCYTVGEFSSIGKPATSESDGPQGISSMAGDANDFGCAWCSAPILAATFNVELAYEMGAAVGQEGLASGISAWYAPGMDTHRSPFSGRNFEYYSEDAVLTGTMGTYVTGGAADNGVSTVIKHLFLNDQESNRNHINTWCSEQAMRELYLKPFEMTIKNATYELKYISDDQGTVTTKTMRAANGIMTSMGNIGTSYCGTNYALVTNVLRGEFGFRGMIMTDMGENSCNSKDLMIRAGVDEYMYFETGSSADLKDATSATMQNATREAVKQMCYMVVNNSSMNGLAPGATITYTVPLWKKLVYLVDVICAVGIVLLIVAIVRRRKGAK